MKVPSSLDRELELAISAISTPALVYSRKRIVENCQRLASVFQEQLKPRDVTFYYSIKTANHPELLRLIAGSGIGAEVISLFELEEAAAAQFASITLDGVMRTPELLSAALARNVSWIGCESLTHVQQLCSMTSLNTRSPQRASLRLKVTPRRRLGMSEGDIHEAGAMINSSSSVSFEALHVHPGSNISDRHALQTYKFVAEVFARCSVCGFRPNTINIGGGFPTFSTGDRSYCVRLGQLHQLFPPEIKIIAEPGRPIVGDAAILLSTICDVRAREHLILIDSAAHVVYGMCGATPSIFWWDSHSGRLQHLIPAEERAGWRIGGIWPAEGDSFWVHPFGTPRPGDRIVFGQAGAYTLSALGEISFEAVHVRVVG